jgi:prophage regulatory protein
VGWPSDEVIAVNKARIAGATDAQLRELIIRLHEKRKDLLKDALA